MPSIMTQAPAAPSQQVSEKQDVSEPAPVQQQDAAVQPVEAAGLTNQLIFVEIFFMISVPAELPSNHERLQAEFRDAIPFVMCFFVVTQMGHSIVSSISMPVINYQYSSFSRASPTHDSSLFTA